MKEPQKQIKEPNILYQWGDINTFSHHTGGRYISVAFETWDVPINSPDLTEKNRIANILKRYYNNPRKQIDTFPWPVRISIVESAGNVLLDLFMKPPFSQFSFEVGPHLQNISQDMIRNGMETKSCVPLIEHFLANSNVIGYPLHYNLMILEIIGVDTSKIKKRIDLAKFPKFISQDLNNPLVSQTRSLADLVREYLPNSVQYSEETLYRSNIDARAVMALYQTVKDEEEIEEEFFVKKESFVKEEYFENYI